MKTEKQQSDNDSNREGLYSKPIKRRQLLKAIVAAGGSVVVFDALPEEWTKPIVEVGVIPAHAQGSPPQGSTPVGDLQVIAQWQDDVDLNLRVREPNDTNVTSGNEGPTLIHQGNTTFQEIVKNKTVGVVLSGVYRIFLEWPAASAITPNNEPDPQPTVIIISHTEGKNIGSIIISEGDTLEIAEVTFPDGAIKILV